MAALTVGKARVIPQDTQRRKVSALLDPQGRSDGRPTLATSRVGVAEPRRRLTRPLERKEADGPVFGFRHKPLSTASVDVRATENAVDAKDARRVSRAVYDEFVYAGANAWSYARVGERDDAPAEGRNDGR